MRAIITLIILFSINTFALTHKISIDARDYIQNEIDLTAPIAQKTKNLLNADTADNGGGGEWNVQVTQNSSLASAVEAANNYGAEKLIIIRMNKYDSVVHGAETYARTSNTTENDLAEKVQTNVVNLTGLTNRGVKNTAGDSNANMEVIMLYPGFMDNSGDYALMSSVQGQENIAKGIMFGIQEHFGLTAYDPNAIHDTTPPTITITSPQDGQTFTTNTITVTGSVTDDFGIDTVKINNVAITLDGNNFSKEITLNEGSNTIEVYALDTSGNHSTETITVTYNHTDTTKPSIIIAFPTYGATVAMQNIDIKGSVRDDDSGVKYFKIDGINVPLEANGSFSYSVVLSPGLNTFQLEASDNNNNIERRDFKVTYEEEATDTTPPVINVISPSDNQTVNTETINIQGYVTDESPIQLFTINGRNIELSNNEFNMSLNLAQGENEIKFYARDSFGNQSNKSITVIYNPSAADTNPPVITINNYNNNDKVNEKNIAIQGKVTDDNEVVSFKINSVTVPLNNDGTFVYNALLDVGENIFNMEATDNNGNTANKKFILYLQSSQNSGPEIIITSPRDKDVVYKDNVDIKGLIRDSDGIKYASVNNYKITLNNDNTFSFNLPLVLGENKITVTAKDNADNTSEVILTVTYKQKITKSDDGGCSFSDTDKNFTNLIFFLIMLLVSFYFKRIWKTKTNR